MLPDYPRFHRLHHQYKLGNIWVFIAKNVFFLKNGMSQKSHLFMNMSIKENTVISKKN